MAHFKAYALQKQANAFLQVLGSSCAALLGEKKGKLGLQLCERAISISFIHMEKGQLHRIIVLKTEGS